MVDRVGLVASHPTSRQKSPIRFLAPRVAAAHAQLSSAIKANNNSEGRRSNNEGAAPGFALQGPAAILMLQTSDCLKLSLRALARSCPERTD